MTAEAILYKENDPLLRYAIYKAYKYRCAYTGKFLYDYSSMHLDHIIPQNTAPEVLQEKIRKYHLADDFTIDSLENILPTKSLHNNSQKNRHPFSEPAERFFLEYAQRGKWKIEREYKILKKETLYQRSRLLFELIRRPLKTIFQREVCKSEVHADFSYKPQKNSHSSFEVICGRS